MTARPLIVGIAVILCSMIASAGQDAPRGRAHLHEQIRALKGALARSKAALAAYSWIETTVIRLDGEVKQVVRKACRPGPDGRAQKTGLDDRELVSKKTAALITEMQALAELVDHYIPPEDVHTRGAWQSGNASVSPRPGGWTALVFNDYLKPGDRLSIELDPDARKIRLVTVSTYRDRPGDVVTFTTRYGDLPDGTSHVLQSELVAMKQRVRVTIVNAQYTRLSS